MLRRKLIYIQVHQGHLVARVAGDAKAVRRECAALCHPRKLTSDFAAIQLAMSELVKGLLPMRWYSLRPQALVHLVPIADGGFTTLELRALKEATEAAGVSFGWLCDDRVAPLTDSQLAEFTSASR